jgi:hypothetical protein
MSEEVTAPTGGETPIAAVTPIVDDGGELSIEQAVQLRRQREQEKDQPAPVEKAEKAAPVEQAELPDEGNAAADEDQPTGETQEGDPEETPPLALPRSWTKEQAEHWNALPRATQEYLTAQASKDSAEVRRVQNEIAEQRKVIQTEREAAEKAKQQYEAQLPALMQELQNAQQNAFSDIRTVDDVTKLANEDPFRYLQWQAHQTKLQAVHAEAERAKSQQAQKQQSEWTEHVNKENALAAELIPDLADKDKGPALMKRAAERLSDLGFKNDELNDYASGKQRLSIYDHRFQQLVADSLKLADIQSATKPTPAAKPLPPVQRPGTSRPASSGVNAQIQTLTKQLANASGDSAIRISAKILGLRRSAGQKG